MPQRESTRSWGPSRGFGTPPTASGRDVDHEGDDESDDRPQAPLPAEPVMHRRIPEERGREEDEPENRPQQRCEDALEPRGEEPQYDDEQSRGEKSEDCEEAGHLSREMKGDLVAWRRHSEVRGKLPRERALRHARLDGGAVRPTPLSPGRIYPCDRAKLIERDDDRERTRKLGIGLEPALLEAELHLAVSA